MSRLCFHEVLKRASVTKKVKHSDFYCYDGTEIKSKVTFLKIVNSGGRFLPDCQESRPGEDRCEETSHFITQSQTGLLSLAADQNSWSSWLPKKVECMLHTPQAQTHRCLELSVKEHPERLSNLEVQEPSYTSESPGKI